MKHLIFLLALPLLGQQQTFKKVTINQTGGGVGLALSGGTVTMGGTTVLDTSRNGTFVNVTGTGTAGFSGTITSTAGNITSTSTGNGTFIATGGAFGDGAVRLKSNSGTQEWVTKSSGTTNNYVIRDDTVGADYLTITKATGAIAVPGALTATGTLTTNSGNVTSTSSGSAGFVATAGAFGSATVDLKSNSATQRWIAKSDGGSGNFVVRDETATTDYFTITKATGAVGIPGALTVGSCTGCTSGVTSVTGTSPIASSGGATPDISCSTCITTAGGQTIAGTTTVSTLTASSAITIGTNNGTTATAGAGFVVSKAGAAYSILGYDNTGACGFGVLYGGAACTSDGTLKNNVQTIGSVISQIMALRPVTYNWNSTGASGMGLIAQEVQAAIPDFKDFLVTLNPDSGKLALSMTNIVPLLIRAIQEMQVEIDVLKGSGK